MDVGFIYIYFTLLVSDIQDSSVVDLTGRLMSNVNLCTWAGYANLMSQVLVTLTRMAIGLLATKITTS